MPLRLELGPFEKLFIGKSVLTNSGARVCFIVDGETPLLRARDVLTQAANALEKLYLCVQQMYLEADTLKFHDLYLTLMVQTISEYPAYYADLDAADRLVKNGQHFKALRHLKKFIRQGAFR